jgi:predicted heme/steroid binding protein/uncharacterized membrane protein
LAEDEREITVEELEQYNGTHGKPTYIAYQGRVIDVSQSTLWAGGVHMNRHRAGADLTVTIQAAPHGAEVLERFPHVGVLKTEAPAERPMPNALSGLLSRFPSLRRHPHPMIVHFPIAFMISAPLLTIFYLVTGIKSFETTAFHCLGGGILFIPLAILTGLFTWWLNYLAKPIRPVTIKKWLSLVLLFVSVTVLVWRMIVPGVLDSHGVERTGYLALMVSLIPLVAAIGKFGGTLTFPVDRG